MMEKKPKKASLDAIYKFTHKLGDTLLHSCELTMDKPYYKANMREATHLMVCRCIYPKIEWLINYLLDKDDQSKENDKMYARRIEWMKGLSQVMFCFVFTHTFNAHVPYICTISHCYFHF